MTNNITWGDLYNELESYMKGQIAPIDISEAAEALSIPESLIRSFSEINPNIVIEEDKNRVYHRGTANKLTAPSAIRSILGNAEEALSAGRIAEEVQKVVPEVRVNNVHTALYNMRKRGEIVRIAGKYSLASREDDVAGDHAEAVLVYANKLLSHATALAEENSRLRKRLEEQKEKLRVLEEIKESVKKMGVVL